MGGKAARRGSARRVRADQCGGPGLPANCQGQCSPEHWEASAEREQEREKKNPYSPTGGLIFSIHKRASVWIHRKFYARSQIPPRLWPGRTHVDEERASTAVVGCRGQNSRCQRGPEPRGRTWRRDSRGQMMRNKQTNNWMHSAPKQHRAPPPPPPPRSCICTVFLTVTPAPRSRLGQCQSCLIREALSSACNGEKNKTDLDTAEWETSQHQEGRIKGREIDRKWKEDKGSEKDGGGGRGSGSPGEEETERHNGISYE